MKTEKMKVLLYLKKSGKDKQGKAPIMGRITLGKSIAQFSCKLSCNPDLWNPRESRMDGKSREAVEVNARLESLLLSVQTAYQSLLSKGCPFDATDIKEEFQGSVQSKLLLSGKNKQKVLYLFIHRYCSRFTHPGAWFSVSNCKYNRMHLF